MTLPGDADIQADARRQIETLQHNNLDRRTRAGVPSPQYPHTSVYRVVDDRLLVNFSSNDYLDLALHPQVQRAACDAVETFGAGATASRLICGDTPLHQQLEAELAAFKGTEAALVFSSGYMACLGVIQTLRRRADGSSVPVLFDKLSHASLIDACTQARSPWRSFAHNDVDALSDLLKKHATAGAAPSALVVTEGIFSMDGDVAPLREMHDLCERHNALLVVDDAHGTGTVGAHGGGTVALAGLQGAPRVVQVGTLSKALGAQGGFVAGYPELRDLLVNTARTFIFDTGLSPAAGAAALRALQLLREDASRVDRLQENARLFRRSVGLPADGVQTPIIPVVLKDESRALQAARELELQGFLVVAIRPPTVPRKTSRLRVTLSAGHTADQVLCLAESMKPLID